MKRLALILLGLLGLLALLNAASAQVTVIGPVTPGDCTAFNSTTVLKDAGFPCSGTGSPVIGPATSTTNGLPIWANAIGTQLKDGNGQSIAGTYSWSNTTTSTSPATGSQVFAGGVGIQGNLFVQGDGTATGGITQINGQASNFFVRSQNSSASTSAASGFAASLTNVSNAFGQFIVANGTVPVGQILWGAGVSTAVLGISGVNIETLTSGGGVQVGAPTGGDKGVGSLNSVTSYQNGVQNIACTPIRAGDLAYWNGAAWTCLAGNNSGTNILQETAAGVPSWTAAGSGSVQSVTCAGVTFTVNGTCPPTYGFTNCAITASVASNNLTITLTDNAGATPSATSPCNIYFRNSTLATGTWTQVMTTATVTFTANSGSTFGATNTAATCRAAASCPFKLWVVAINSGAGVVLGVVDLTNASGVDPLNEAVLLSTTACNACGTATAIGTVYSTAAQTTKPFVILGYLEWGSGLATAGTYASGPTAIQSIGPGVFKPGQIIQRQMCCTGSVTTVSPAGTTFGGGTNSNITQAIVPTMASNPVRFTWSTTALNGTAATPTFCQMSDNSGPTALGSIGKMITNSASTAINVGGGGLDTPGVTTSKTYVVRCWVTGGTGTVPGVSTDGAYEEVAEIMG